MALIVCAECGREISDQTEKCIHCGYAVKQETPIQTVSTKANKKSKILIIIAAVIVALGILCVSVAIINTDRLNVDEQYAYEVALSLKRSLYYPDSLVLVDDIVLLKFDEVITIIKYQGDNQYGNTVTGRAVFVDGVYRFDYLDDSITEWDDAVTQVWVGNYYRNEYDGEDFVVKIDAEKIQKALDPN